jgi:hypothetical protein
MNKALRGGLALPILLTLLAGCDAIWDGQAAPPVSPPPGPGSVESSQSSGLKAAMKKIGQGPGALTPTLAAQLNAEKPAWETIQPETKEYAQLASETANYNPTRGSKESWAKLCAEFTATASDLNKAAQAKDKAAALSAHGQLSNTCMGCHREHRGRQGGPPGGPPRGPGGGGPPPPGAPGGPPPGGPPPK